MPLLANEVQLGNVAYFDHKILLREPDIDRDDDGLNRPGPFLCVQVKGDRSVWVAITSHHRPERLPIEDGWRVSGNDFWRKTPAYLVDGLCTYLGPNAAFIRAAAAERPFHPHQRPKVAEAGVQAVMKEIDKQGGPLLDT